jgi:hypothetical protein
MLSFILSRFSERSTWLGLTAFATAGGLNVAPELSTAIINAGIAVAGLIGVITKDKAE